MKKLPRWILPVVLLLLAVFAWRLTHPKLTDEQQLRVALDDIATQAGHKNAGGITYYLSKDFRVQGLGPNGLKKQLVGGFLEYAAVRLNTSGVQVKVTGDTATTTGVYDIGLKKEFTSPEDKFSDIFTLQWKREDGEWKIADAPGVKAPMGLGGG